MRQFAFRLDANRVEGWHNTAYGGHNVPLHLVQQHESTHAMYAKHTRCDTTNLHDSVTIVHKQALGQKMLQPTVLSSMLPKLRSSARHNQHTAAATASLLLYRCCDDAPCLTLLHCW